MSSEKTTKDKTKRNSSSSDKTKSSSDNGLEENWQNVELNEQGDPEAVSDGSLRESPELITEEEATEEFTEIDRKDIPSEENLEANGKPYGGFVSTSKPMRRGGLKGGQK
ncbi:hypothetical protein AC578_9408 [Pseudocercospora eumusae]|uniref:Uncharacterized protein n=1 Tax=Pseudocercospora eumusae TaxID=321146 RepID=A0A139H6Q3_9PEZI|nr:hypothetical protein AC578_9408 [Pseudocercospora eumusae]